MGEFGVELHIELGHCLGMIVQVFGCFRNLKSSWIGEMNMKNTLCHDMSWFITYMILYIYSNVYDIYTALSLNWSLLIWLYWTLRRDCWLCLVKISQPWKLRFYRERCGGIQGKFGLVCLPELAFFWVTIIIMTMIQIIRIIIVLIRIMLLSLSLSLSLSLLLLLLLPMWLLLLLLLLPMWWWRPLQATVASRGVDRSATGVPWPRPRWSVLLALGEC